MSDKIVRFCYDHHLLGEEVVVEILIRLPTKSVIRFKSVCKSWRSLIGSPQFLAKHLLPARDHLLLVKGHDVTDRYRRRVLFSLLSNQTLAEQSQPRPLPYPELPGSHPDSIDIEIMGPCNGLVCLFDGEHNHIVLWSLADGEIKHVPRGARVLDPDLGFGYDPDSDDHKVVRISTVEEEEEEEEEEEYVKVEVYSFKADSWKCIEIGDAFLQLRYGADRSVACADGVFLCWAADEILWFRMSDESFGVTQPPTEIGEFLTNYDINVDPEDGPSRQVNLFVLNDNKVALVAYERGPRNVETCFDVWVMLEFGVETSWTRLFTVRPLVRIQRPLLFWKNGKIIMETSHGRLVLCDPFDGVTESLQICGAIDSFQIVPIRCQHMASVYTYRTPSHGEN